MGEIDFPSIGRVVRLDLALQDREILETLREVRAYDSALSRDGGSVGTLLFRALEKTEAALRRD